MKRVRRRGVEKAVAEISDKPCSARKLSIFFLNSCAANPCILAGISSESNSINKSGMLILSQGIRLKLENHRITYHHSRLFHAKRNLSRFLKLLQLYQLRT